MSSPCSEEKKRKISASLMGHSVSAETRKKQSLAKIGKISPMRGKVGGNKGKHWRWSEEDKQRKKLMFLCGFLSISDEQRQQMSKRMKGQPAWNKGKNCPQISDGLMGHPVSKESRQRMSKSHIGLQSRENNPNWQGGVSYEPYGMEFNRELKNKVRERDGFLCQICYTFSSQELDVHHIDEDKTNNEMSNLISLCRSYHQVIHGLQIIRGVHALVHVLQIKSKAKAK